MSDEISLEARLAVSAGFAYAAGTSGKKWAAKMDEGVRLAASAMNGKYARLAQSILDAAVFKGEYRGYRLEESSTRLIVEIYTGTVSERSKRKDGVDEIRTDRTDSFTGQLMKERLDALEVGTPILAFKVMEPMKDSSDKVRILGHFEVLGRVPDKGATGTQLGEASGRNPGSTPGPPSAPPEDLTPEPHTPPSRVSEEPVKRHAPAPKSAEASPSASADENDDPFNRVSVGALIGDLPGPKAAKLARLARAEGINNIMSGEHAERVKELMATL